MSFDLNTIYKEVLPHVPGAVSDQLAVELRAVLRNFCERSDVWVEGIEITTEAGTLEYEIYPDVGVIVRLMNVVNSDNSPVAASMAMEDIVVLARDSGQVETLTANVSVRPDATDDCAEQLPEWVFTKYYDAFVSGLIARLMLQPAKPYSNAQMGTYHNRKYEAALYRAKNQALQRYKFRGQGWEFPRGFR